MIVVGCGGGDDDDDAGYYTEDCSKPCPEHCAEGYCSRRDGFCECQAGLFGPTCDLPCPDGAWGPNCVHECRCHAPNSLGCDPRVRRTVSSRYPPPGDSPPTPATVFGRLFLLQTSLPMQLHSMKTVEAIIHLFSPIMVAKKRNNNN